MTDTIETEKIVGVNTEEKTHKTEVKVDLSSIQAGLADMMAKVKDEILNSVKATLAEEKMKVQPQVMETVKTKGIVKEEAKVEESKDSDIVIEKADSGRGFQIYNNYDKGTCKFKRLVR